MSDKKWIDLYNTQRRLQESLRIMPSPWMVKLALLDELGELIHLVKPFWAWWKRSDLAEKAKPQLSDLKSRVLDEAADILHFILLNTLAEKEPGEKLDFLIDSQDYAHNFQRNPMYGFSFHLRAVAMHVFPMQGITELMKALTALGNALTKEYSETVTFTPEELYDAYLEKAKINLVRWGIKLDETN